MGRLLKYLVFFFLFWFIVFTANRLVFLFSIVFLLNDASEPHILHSLFAGWLLDLSTIGYIALLPVLTATLYFIFRKKWIGSIADFIVFFTIVIYCMICFGELCVYREWRSKLTMQALLHFRHPAEVFQSATTKQIIWFFSLTVIFSFLYIGLFRKKFSLARNEFKSRPSLIKRVITGILFLPVFLYFDVILIRGGWQPIPISESDAYYSQHHELNDVAVNPAWNLVHDMLEYSSVQKENPYLFMKDEEANKEMQQMFGNRGMGSDSTTINILTTGKPNIVFLILESYTAYAIPAFGGDPYALFLDSLARAGICFSNCYAAAYVSDQGIPAILSSYPSAPHTAVINQISKSVNLPCIAKDLKPLGYHSGFLFGGQLNYGNIRSYLFNMNFDRIKEGKEFLSSHPPIPAQSIGKLGIHDRAMAPLAVEEISKAAQPFIYAWFTISSHSPYDIPEPIKPLEKKENDYVNTLVYTDKAIQDFFAAASKQPWYHNTLFVIVADHSHPTHRDYSIEEKEYHHIPLIFFGDVIKPGYRGKKIDDVVSHLDIVPTLLNQIHGKNTTNAGTSNQYTFGKNIFDPQLTHFAYYVYFSGTGFIENDCYISVQKEGRAVIRNTCADSSRTRQLLHKEEAFLQKAFEDYLKR